MKADITVVGVPRLSDSNQNARKLDQAVDAFRNQYPKAIVVDPKVEPVGANSQTILFSVTAPNLESAQAMQAFFEQQLEENGFARTGSVEDAASGVVDLLQRVASSGSDTTYVSGEPAGEEHPTEDYSDQIRALEQRESVLAEERAERERVRREVRREHAMEYYAQKRQARKERRRNKSSLSADKTPVARPKRNVGKLVVLILALAGAIWMFVNLR